MLSAARATRYYHVQGMGFPCHMALCPRDGVPSPLSSFFHSFVMPKVLRRKTKRSKRVPLFAYRVKPLSPIPSYVKRSIRSFTKKAFKRKQPSYGGGATFVYASGSKAPVAPLLALPDRNIAYPFSQAEPLSRSKYATTQFNQTNGTKEQAPSGIFDTLSNFFQFGGQPDLRRRARR